MVKIHLGRALYRSGLKDSKAAITFHDDKRKHFATQNHNNMLKQGCCWYGPTPTSPLG